MRYSGVGGVRLFGCHDDGRGIKYFFWSGAELSLGWVERELEQVSELEVY